VDSSAIQPNAFAFKAGPHRTYISGIERGVRNPTILVLGEIALALGVPPARLLENVPRKRARRGIARLTGRELADQKRSRLSRGELTPFSERGSRTAFQPDR
jgi:transcriptional regulator with XRE-family HTH domain